MYKTKHLNKNCLEILKLNSFPRQSNLQAFYFTLFHFIIDRYFPLKNTNNNA